MPRTRRTYTPEFKAQAVNLVTGQGHAVAEAARPLGRHDSLSPSRKQPPEVRGDRASPGHGQLSPSGGENRRRRADNKRLLAGRDPLEEAAAFFAGEAT